MITYVLDCGKRLTQGGHWKFGMSADDMGTELIGCMAHRVNCLYI
jgi:hypothetical protein